MKYPLFLSIGNSLYQRVNLIHLDDVDYMYIATSRYGVYLNMPPNLKTYKQLVEEGYTEPSNEEVIRLLDLK